jgi:hypothetical protein
MFCLNWVTVAVFMGVNGFPNVAKNVRKNVHRGKLACGRCLPVTGVFTDRVWLVNITMDIYEQAVGASLFLEESGIF